jgi:hypothetical protein
MAVPNIFGTATAAIPLSNLDTNFATPITLGNTAIQLGNTVTTLNNITLANATVSSLSTAITVAQGGTGLTSTPANGALDIGNGTGFTRATLTAGLGVSITNGSGSITIAASATSGSVVQVAYAELLTSGTTSAAIPADDTIPQNTEGTEILTLTMTPLYASSYLLVQVIANLSENTDVAGPQGAIAAIFRDSTADAIAADFALGDALTGVANALNVANFSFCFRVAATAATSTTFKLRVGGETAVSMRWNGFNSSRKLGGSWRTSMTVTEITA